MLCILFLLLASSSHGQSASARLKVFLDCSAGCDGQFIRSEITVVDFVLDRLAADVHLLITAQPNGSGGSDVQLSFLGQNGYKGTNDRLSCAIPGTATAVEKRTAITDKIKLGLIPYIRYSPSASLVHIDMKSGGQQGAGTPVRKNVDRWNYWVYRVGLDGTYNADKVYQNSIVSGSITANRTTEQLRVNFAAYANNNFATYQYDQNGTTQTYEVENSDYIFSHYLVKSLSPHWSAGYELAYSNSTFSNNKARIYASPAIEYSVFPYRELNEQFLTFSYGPEVRHNTYYDTTIYNQTSELLWGHKLKANLAIRQKWGSVTTALSYSNYLHDWQLNNLSVSLNVDVRITGGLSVYIYTSGGLVHDQVYLVKGGATEQEILTRRRQLASSYNFYSGVGISYRFGSILNNFVNPRFPNY